MSTTNMEERTGLPAGLGGRILSEGYGAADAWHGSNLRAALADVAVRAGVLEAGTRATQHRGDRDPSRLVDPSRSARGCRARPRSRSSWPARTGSS